MRVKKGRQCEGREGNVGRERQPIDLKCLACDWVIGKKSMKGSIYSKDLEYVQALRYILWHSKDGFKSLLFLHKFQVSVTKGGLFF
jgi:hypothetical protein